MLDNYLNLIAGVARKQGILDKNHAETTNLIAQAAIKFTSSPTAYYHQPKAAMPIPCLRLVLFPLLPLISPATIFIAEQAGHKWDVGNFIGIIFLFAILWGLAFIAETIMLFGALQKLDRWPSYRTPINVCCVAFASLFVVFSIVFSVVFWLWLAF